jgi:cytoskeletal protein CcmA (bactofilin family)
MAIPFLQHIDLNKNELQNIVVQNLGTAPSSPKEGQIYYHTSDDTIYLNTSADPTSPSWTSLGGDISGVNITAGNGLSGASVNTTTGTHTQTLTIGAGTGITVNSGDVAVTAAQTGITSILNSALVVGRDAHNQIDFSTDNEIKFKTNNETPVIIMKASGEIEATSLDISGDVDVDGTLETDVLTINGTASVPFEAADHSKLDGIEASADVTDTTNVKAALNANLGGATFGDSNDTITIPGTLIVTGDTKYHNETIQIVENNTISFEGTTADAHEVHLTSADATADRTITLPNLAGHVPLLAVAATETITSTPAELNILDGVTSNTAELNVLDGYTGSVTELNYLDTLHATGVTSTEYDYLDGVTSNIQTQLDATEDASNKITKKLSGDGSNTTYSITHGFGTPIVQVQVLHYGDNGSGATYDVVQVEIERDTDNAVDIIFGTAPTTAEDYLVLISKFPAIS